MKQIKLIVAVMILWASVAPAEAHLGSKVTICIPYYQGARCARGEAAPSYQYGDTVVVKGHAKPEHDGIVRIKRRKGHSPWIVVARVALDGDGHYRYAWQTHRSDADQNTPYKFKTLLPQHDVSPTQKVLVLYGE